MLQIGARQVHVFRSVVRQLGFLLCQLCQIPTPPSDGEPPRGAIMALMGFIPHWESWRGGPEWTSAALGCSHILVDHTDGSRVRAIEASNDWPLEKFRHSLRSG
jgi:hypothetical protein